MIPSPTIARPWMPGATDPVAGARLARELGISDFLATLLVQRGVTDPEAGRRFLEPSVDDLLDPCAMADMAKAAERVARAVREREPIVIYGDYDVDGLTATALLVEFLRFLGAEPGIYVPNRAYEGYSFTEGGVRFIKEHGARVVISVDNGITSIERVAELQAAGVDVIVTDHHLPGPTLPPAFAVCNPRRADCGYPFKGLAGVGLAFKLACATCACLSEGQRRSPELMRFLGEAMAWVALGTIADMVPLAGENRTLVARGLRAIPRSTSPGLVALCRVAGVRASDFSAQDVSFKLAPRLNAAGRMGSAERALDLLVARDTTTAHRLAGQLDELNNQRRLGDRQLFGAAMARVADEPAAGPLLLADDHWPPGLLGLVAGRMAQATGRPAVLVSFASGEHGKGSARSAGTFDLHAALAACGEHLVSHGGHAMAAGFTLAKDRLDAFRAALAAHWASLLAQPATNPFTFEAELPLAALTLRVVEELERLAPFGQGNPRPVLGAMGLTVHAARTIGDGTHLELRLGQGPAVLRAMFFGQGERAAGLPPGLIVDALYTVKLNRFRGRPEVELELVDLRSSTSATAAATSAAAASLV